MNPYLKIARPDHWFKNVFILPGIALAISFGGEIDLRFAWSLPLGICALCMIASSNYTINEWLDREFDRVHPLKKFRASVQEQIDGRLVYLQWGSLAVAGLILSTFVGWGVLTVNAVLLIMGLAYNVRPLRTKDHKYVDVLSESVNNPLRFLLGWYIVNPPAAPPSSVLVAYWMGGAFLMGVKRYAEYRHIGNPELAGKYRRSFKYYTEETLLLSSILYALISAVLLGVFLVRHRIEFLLSVPLFCILFVWYLHIGMRPDSVSQAPENLHRERAFMAYVLFMSLATLLLFFIQIPWLQWLLDPNS